METYYIETNFLDLLFSCILILSSVIHPYQLWICWRPLHLFSYRCPSCVLDSRKLNSSEYYCWDVSRHLTYNIFKTELIIFRQQIFSFCVSSFSGWHGKHLTQLLSETPRSLPWHLIPLPFYPEHPTNYQYLSIQLYIESLSKLISFLLWPCHWHLLPRSPYFFPCL